MKLRHRRVFSILVALGLVLLAGIGCGDKQETPGYDLDKVVQAANTGMSEFDFTVQVGAPHHIDVEGDVRTLRYNAREGKEYVEIVFKRNVLTEVHHRD